MEYEALKKESSDKLVKGAENHIEGLSDHITMIECITPLDCKDRVRAVRGGMYGPAHIPSQMDMNRFHSLTCGVEGLFLAGAGTMGSGLLFCASSGFFAAEKSISYLNDLGSQKRLL
jgi:phytoene dehydrogenase-like protein